MIRSRFAALLSAGLLALPCLSLIGSPVHAATDITGLWFNYDNSAPIYLADIRAACVTKSCRPTVFTVQYSTPSGIQVGPLPAQQDSSGGLSITLPCAHEPNSPICIPGAPSTSVTFTPAGANLRADMVTINGVLRTQKTETLCRCIPG